MRIGIDASQANRQKRRGTEWYAYHIIQELKEIADPEDQFILYSKEPLVGLLAQLPPNFSSRVLRWPPKFLWNQIRFSIEVLLHRPDVLFCPAHTVPFFAPHHMVTTVHDVGFERFAKLYSTNRIGPASPVIQRLLGIATKIITLGKYSNTEFDYHRWSARRALAKASVVTTVSQFSKLEILNTLGNPKNPIVIIPNGIDRETFFRRSGEEQVTVQKKYGIRRPYLFWIGSIEEKKNVLTLVKAFEILKGSFSIPHALVIAGIPGYGYDRIHTAIQESPFSNDILEIGYAEEEDTAALYSGADCFVFPSAYEGFGIPIIESMACGTPVAASRAASNPEIGKDAVVYFDSQNAEECANVVFRVLRDADATQQRMKQGLVYARAYSWRETAQRIYALLQSERGSPVSDKA